MTIARNTLYGLASAGVSVVVAVVSVPFFISAIGAERYGALATAWLLLGYFGQADLGIGRAITQRVSQRRHDAEAIADALWSAKLGVIAFGLASGVLVYLAAGYFFSEQFKVGGEIRRELLDSRLLLALCTPVGMIGGVASGALVGIERFRAATISSALSNVLVQVLPLLAALWIGPSLDILIAASLLGRVLGTANVIFAAWASLLRGQRFAPSAGEFRHLLHFGVWVMVTSFVGPLMTMADRFVIGAVLGAVAVAAYTIPFQIAQRTMVLPISLVTALFPRFAAEDPAAARDRCAQSTVFVAQAFAIVAIGLICLADPLMKLWLGAKLDPRSVAIAQIVMAGFWINAVANVPYSLIQARGNPRFTATLHLVELPMYCLLLWGLGQLYGLPGVAAAFSVRCAIDTFVLMTKAGASDRPVLAGVAVPGALVLAATVAGFAWHGWAASLAGAAVLCGLAAIVALWRMPDMVRSQLAGAPVLGPILARRRRLPGGSH